MSLQLDFQCVSSAPEVPAEADFQRWLDQCFSADPEMSVVVRVVDESESQQLNADYRGKDQPTNVLSFPFDVPEGIPVDHLGDLVICATVVQREALEQSKRAEDHWAHMLIHGVLHLKGYDHIEDREAEEMETIEVSLLQKLSISNPYELP